MNITKVIFSAINDKWYLQINNCEEIETTEKHAKFLIEKYKLQETNMFRWELI